MSRWQFRKRLNKEDAAHILHLLDDAEQLGVKRKVFFNQFEKTKDDIQAYIRKTNLVKSPEELLQYLDLEERSPYITWVDEDRNEDAFNSSNGVPSPAAGTFDPFERWSPPEAGEFQSDREMSLEILPPNFEHEHGDQLISSGSSAGFVIVPPVEGVESLPSDSPADEEESPPETEAFMRNDSQGPDSSPLLDLPGPYTNSDRDQLFPNEPFPNTMAQWVDWQGINGLLSNSPLQTHLSPEALAQRIDAMFCKMEAVGRDAVARLQVAIFLRHCCAATIYGGQDYPLQRAASIGDAVNAFRQILFQNPWDSLTTLNNMFALLGMYGHRIIVLDILNATRGAVNQYIEVHRHANFAVVVRSVLHFMTTIPETGQRPSYQVDSLAEMEQQARSCFPNHPEFALSAAYVHAWGLLEMNCNADALHKLHDLRIECEEVFDYGQFQTICWLATLARAYAANGRNKMAANTYRDVAGRIARYFNTSHPQYWDSVYRQACFDRRVIDEFTDMTRQLQGWLNVAQTMQHTLKWRADVLGHFNPQTLQNFKALRGVLIKLERVDDSATLEQIINIDLA